MLWPPEWQACHTHGCGRLLIDAFASQQMIQQSLHAAEGCTWVMVTVQNMLCDITIHSSNLIMWCMHCKVRKVPLTKTAQPTSAQQFNAIQEY